MGQFDRRNRQKMKIVFFINKLYGGGAERVATILMNHLCENHHITAIVFDSNNDSYKLNDKVSIHRISVSSQFRIPRLIERIKKIRKEIKTTTPDIIISFLTPINIYVLTASLFLRKKIIISERNTLNRVHSKLIRLIRRLTYPMADKIVFVTDADRIKFGLPGKSLTIYNPSALSPFPHYTDRQNIIVSIAPTDRWYNKGIDLLITGWAKIAHRNPDWAVEIYGRISDAKLPNGITLQNQKRVKWMGWTNDIAEMLRKKSIFILASRFEGCPNSMIEAMSQGCACIGTDCEGGIKEIITDGADGIIAKCENANDISEKLQMLIDDKNLRLRLSTEAIEKTKLFDKNVFFAKWDKLIEEVAWK